MEIPIWLPEIPKDHGQFEILSSSNSNIALSTFTTTPWGLGAGGSGDRYFPEQGHATADLHALQQGAVETWAWEVSGKYPRENHPVLKGMVMYGMFHRQSSDLGVPEIDHGKPHMMDKSNNDPVIYGYQ